MFLLRVSMTLILTFLNWSTERALQLIAVTLLSNTGIISQLGGLLNTHTPSNTTHEHVIRNYIQQVRQIFSVEIVQVRPVSLHRAKLQLHENIIGAANMQIPLHYILIARTHSYIS